MKYNALHDAGRFSKLRRNRKRWQKVVSVMASIVVFCTTYALILPAITMEQPDTYCGLENHIHGPECYEKVLICDHAGDDVVEATPMANVTEGHTHDETCYEEIKTLICEQEEVVGHKHDSSCETLICSLEETSGHSHSDACYEIQYETKTWTEEVTVNDGEELTCTSTEEGHEHDGSCYTAKSHTETVEHTEQVEVGRVLTCTTPESAPHSHDASCYQMVCTQEEVEGHTHTDECYTVEQGELICEIPEVTEAPETTEPEVTEPAEPAHEHSDACYEEKLICGCEIEHEHTADCYIEPPYEPADNEALVCELEEHKHDDACLIAETGELICDLEEHSHDENCYEQLPAFEMWLPLDADIDLDVYTEKHEYIDEDGLYGVTVYAKPDTFDVPVTLEVELLEEDDDRYVNALDVLAAQVEETEEAEEEIVDEAADELAAIDEVTPENTLPEEPAEPTSEAPVVEEEVVEDEVIEEEITAQPALTGEEGMIAFDIHFVDEDGDEVQPLEPVYVHIQAMGLLPEDVDLSTVTVQHIREEQPATWGARLLDMLPFVDETVYIPEVVADMIDEDLGWIDFEPNMDDDEIYDVNTAFEVDGFSTFTITWNNSTTNRLDVQLVDTEGNSIGQDTVKNITSATTVDKAFAPVIDGYEFSYATIGNYRVQQIRYRTYRWQYVGENSSNWSNIGNNVVTFVYESTEVVNRVNFTHSNTNNGNNVTIDTTEWFALSEYAAPTTSTEYKEARLNSATGEIITHLKFTPAEGENEAYWSCRYADGTEAVLEGVKVPSVYMVYGLKTIETVDSASLGVKMNIMNFVGSTMNNKGNNSEDYDFQFVNEDARVNYDSPMNTYTNGHSVRSGIVENTLTANGYPKVVSDYGGDELDYIFSTTEESGKVVYENLNHLFYDAGNGYYEYNSGKHFAELNTTTKEFTVYDQIGAHNGTPPARFMPFDKVTDTSGMDFHFAMTLETDFYMPKNGMVNGQPMEFYFNGDDDVWVFIDGVLVLDIGGIHQEAGGTINFADGSIDYDTQSAMTDTTLYDIFLKAKGKSWVEEKMHQNSKGVWVFNDYTELNLKFFYVERGAGGSNCNIKFNLPTIPKNSLIINKELVGAEGTEAPDGLMNFVADTLEYTFKALTDADNDGAKDDNLFTSLVDDDDEPIVINKYTIMENDVAVGTGTIAEDGSFKLKANQTAVFAEVFPANLDVTYVVQEILPANHDGQYDDVAFDVSGKGGSIGVLEGSQIVKTDEFVTYITSPLTTKNETSRVNFVNKVDLEQLSILEIGKTVTGDTEETQFEFTVKMADENSDTLSPVPVGTPYYLIEGNTTTPKTVGPTAGKIELAAGQKAVFTVLVGTKYEVVEVTDGLTELESVDYTYNVNVPADKPEPDNLDTDFTDGISGEVEVVNSDHLIQVTNRFPSATGDLSITKTVKYNGETIGEDHDLANEEYTFHVSLPVTGTAGLTLTVDGTEQALVTTPTENPTHLVVTLKHGETATITGLAEGNYTVAEQNTDGYSVNWFNNQNPIASGTPTVTAAVTAGAVYAVECQNTTGYALPSTGGIGTTLYTMSGMAMMSAALVGGYGLRRKRERGSEE